MGDAVAAPCFQAAGADAHTAKGDLLASLDHAGGERRLERERDLERSAGAVSVGGIDSDALAEK